MNRSNYVINGTQLWIADMRSGRRLGAAHVAS